MSETRLMEKGNRHSIVLLIAMTALSVLGIAWNDDDLPSRFWMFLRWVVSFSAGVLLVVGFFFLPSTPSRTIAKFVLTIVLILFNPIAPFYLTAPLWKVLDVFAACSFVLGIFVFMDDERE